jgi:circadian clock protein KaiC
MPTGIAGLDEITRGGLPRHSTTLLMGGPGCGKTVLALQTLVNGARLYHEPGIFVAFEENTRRIVRNAATFGWDLPELEQQRLFLLDVRVPTDAVHAGGFDLVGMLETITAKAKEIGAKRIVFDAIDVLLQTLGDPQLERQELYRLNDWLHTSGLTGIMTAKIEGPQGFRDDKLGYLHFMVDCAVVLNHRIHDHVSLRSIRVAKYRGSAFSENEAPLVIGPTGMDVASISIDDPTYEAPTERVSTGIDRLDTMLSGGYFRGACVLIAGAPGTAKSTLSGAFAEAAAKRGERTLYVGFDENSSEIVRNLTSVGIQLAPHVESGLLRIVSTRSEAVSAKEHLARIKALIAEHQPRRLVIDPLSALIRAGGLSTATGVVERLVHLVKTHGITAVFTSLLDSPAPAVESTMVQVSTVADTWIQLSYAINAGERNRALTIIKSRGTRHSNQVRELILSDDGITLADVYASEGQVLMGTLRWQREQAEAEEEERTAAEVERKRRVIGQLRADLSTRIAALRQELENQTAELEILSREEQRRERVHAELTLDVRRIRRADGSTAPTSAANHE